MFGGTAREGSTRRASTHLKFSHSMREIMPFRTVSAPDAGSAPVILANGRRVPTTSLFFRELGSPRSEAQTARRGVLGRRDEGNARERLRERAPRERVQSLTRVRWARARFSPGREVGATRAFEFRARARINLSLGWYRRQFSTSEVVHISGCCLQLARRWPCGSFRERSGASMLAAFASSNGSGVLLLSWRFLYKRAFVFASAHLRESLLWNHR